MSGGDDLVWNEPMDPPATLGDLHDSMFIEAQEQRNRAEAAESQLASLKETVERLRRALFPFAAQADEYSDETPDDSCVWPTFEVGDFRRARSALSSTAPSGGSE